MTSKSGSVPRLTIEPYYIKAAITDEALTERALSLGEDRKKITPQYLKEMRALLLESYHRANKVTETITNKQIRKEVAAAKKTGTSKDAALDKALANGMQKTSEKFERIKDRECEACGESALGKALQKCIHCYTAHYCGKECQAANWKDHKAEWLKRDEIIKETLEAHKPKFVAPEVTGGFTLELCQLIADFDHFMPAKAKS